jgi:branched-chain amino acid aminotransferase
MKIRIDALPPGTGVELPASLPFGRVFTHRMFTRHYDGDAGWKEAAIGPRVPIVVDPAAQVLHYGQSIFEGTKAYARADGRIQLFRPGANAQRFARSAERMAMPGVDPDDFVEAIEVLVALERDWVPRDPGASLYIRPVLMATESTLEVRSSRTFLHYVLLSPAGPFFPGGFAPVAVRVERDHVRAAPGGTGAAKTVGNYAASLAATEAARRAGYQQVLWLDAVERRYVEEAGAMNVAFVRRDGEIVTPALSGSILAGITRDSLLRLAPDLGFPVREARLDIDEILAEVRSGRISEAFCMGTAAVLVPIGRIGRDGVDVTVNDGTPGPVASELYRALTAIQYGEAPDPYGWTSVIDEHAVLERCQG